MEETTSVFLLSRSRLAAVAGLMGLLFAWGTVGAHAEENLLANPGAEAGDFSGWTVVNGGDGWAVTNGPGAHVRTGSHAFVSSFEWGSMSQEIDLLSHGYDAGDLDADAPPVAAETYVVGYGDGCSQNTPYQVIVQLRDEDHNPIETFDTGVATANDAWQLLSHTFEDYGAGLRYVNFEIHGIDACWWLGQYGTVFDDSSVMLLDVLPPEIDATTPEDDETGVGYFPDLEVAFDEVVEKGSGSIYLKSARDNATIEEIDVGSLQVTGDGTDTITIDPSVQLHSGIRYYIEMDGGAFEDEEGNAFAGISGATDWNFTVRGSGSSSSSARSSTYGISNARAELSDSRVNVTWEVQGDANLVVIRKSVDGGAWQTIAGPINSAGTYGYSPASDEQGSKLRFRIEATDLATTLASGETNKVTIPEPVIARSDSALDAAPVEAVATVAGPRMGPSPVDGRMEPITDVAPGTYVKAPSFQTVYFITDSGARRPFPNAATYFTYSDSFADIKAVTDATLPTLALKAVMPPKSGVVLVKTPHDASTYELDETGRLRILASESEAISRYGSQWSDLVIDMEPTFFSQLLAVGAPLPVGNPLPSLALMKSRGAIDALAKKTVFAAASNR